MLYSTFDSNVTFKFIYMLQKCTTAYKLYKSQLESYEIIVSFPQK